MQYKIVGEIENLTLATKMKHFPLYMWLEHEKWTIMYLSKVGRFANVLKRDKAALSVESVKSKQTMMFTIWDL